MARKKWISGVFLKVAKVKRGYYKASLYPLLAEEKAYLRTRK